MDCFVGIGMDKSRMEDRTFKMDIHRSCHGFRPTTYKSTKFLTGQNVNPIPRYQYVAESSQGDKCIFKVYLEMDEWYYRLPARLIGLREMIVRSFIKKYKYLVSAGRGDDDRFEQLLCDDFVVGPGSESVNNKLTQCLSTNYIMLATSYMRGRTLKSITQESSPSGLPAAVKSALMVKFGRIAKDLKSKGLIYLDVHPGNFVVDGDELRVLDMKTLLKFENGKPVDLDDGQANTLKSMMLAAMQSQKDFGFWQSMFPTWRADARPLFDHFARYMEYRFLLMIEANALGWYASLEQVNAFNMRLQSEDSLWGGLA